MTTYASEISHQMGEGADAKNTDAFATPIKEVAISYDSSIKGRQSNSNFESTLKIVGAGDTADCQAVKSEVQPTKNTDDADLNIATKIVKLLEDSFDFYRDVEGSSETYDYFAVRKGQNERPTQISESGRGFLSVARALAYKHYGRAISTTSLHEGVKTLFALLDCGEVAVTDAIVALRSAVFRDENAELVKVVIDLGESTPAVITVDENGWRIKETGDRSVIFKSGGSTRPLTRPKGAADMTSLFKNLGFASDSPQALAVRGWLACAFIADIERPIMTFTGTQGSGKTTRAISLMSCINPPREVNGSGVVGGSLSKLGDEQVKAANSFLVGYDNISHVSQEQSDFIARVVTGDSIEKRALYTNGMLYTVSYKRTGVITCISTPSFAADAMERLIVIKLERFREGQRIGRADLSAALAKGMPNVMSAILDDIATLIRNSGDRILDPPRMADYYANLVRIDQRLGEAYLDAFHASEREQAESSLFVQICRKALQKSPDGVIESEGMPRLYDSLRIIAEREGKQYLANFPQSPRALAAWLASDATLLQAAGVEVTKRKAGGVRYYGLRALQKVAMVASPDSHSGEVASNTEEEGLHETF